MLEQDFTLLTTTSYEKALELVHQNIDIAVVVADQDLAGKLGTDLLSQLKILIPNAARVIISGHLEF